MSKTAKNIMIALGVLTAMYAGYYLFVQNPSLVVRSPENERQLEQMLMRTQEFSNHRQILDSIEMDVTILQTAAFTNLRSFSPKLGDYQAGRINPFIPAGPERTQPPVVVGDPLPAES